MKAESKNLARLNYIRAIRGSATAPFLTMFGTLRAATIPRGHLSEK